MASRPAEQHAGLSLAQAGTHLEAAFRGEAPGLTAVLASYDGGCSVVRFEAVTPLAADALKPAAQIAPATSLLEDAEWDLSGREYRAAVREARERIAAGDVYVLNLTARLTGRPIAAPAELFASLVARAGAEMSALLESWPGATPWVASVSPERFLRVRLGDHGARLVEVCPIKGTRSRSATPIRDRELAYELAADPKERAEHIMVVDLERNDLGICALPGTVHVDPLYEVVPTPYCHQLVSTVHATLRPRGDLRRLAGGDVPVRLCDRSAQARGHSHRRGARTHAPRRLLRSAARGVSGELDSSVLIRTLEGTAEQPNMARWGAGCGITHDSDPSAEYLEMLLKASPVTGDGAPTSRCARRCGSHMAMWRGSTGTSRASRAAGPDRACSPACATKSPISSASSVRRRLRSTGDHGHSRWRGRGGHHHAALLARRRRGSDHSPGHGRARARAAQGRSQARESALLGPSASRGGAPRR